MQSFFGVSLFVCSPPPNVVGNGPLIPFVGGSVCKAYREERTRDLKHPDQSIYTGGFSGSEFTW